jgi:hypothetical protein
MSIADGANLELADQVFLLRTDLMLFIVPFT